jgi:hypothetical protein
LVSFKIVASRRSSGNYSGIRHRDATLYLCLDLEDAERERDEALVKLDAITGELKNLNGCIDAHLPSADPNDSDMVGDRINRIEDTVGLRAKLAAATEALEKCKRKHARGVEERR